jgi:polyhydroxybutyrate depolymerase
LLQVPATLTRGRPAPLVLVFHGGGATAEGTEHMTGFSALADREGFLVAYPAGVGRNWNDGREVTDSTAHREKGDDVGLVKALIDAIGREHPVDPRRVYATGMSNGGIFSHYLAARLSARIAAIAPVVGGMAEGIRSTFSPAQPVSVLILQGTGDPLVPYGGGGVLAGRRGRIIGTEEAVWLWVEANGCAREPASTICPIPTLPMAAAPGASFTRVAARAAR